MPIYEAVLLFRPQLSDAEIAGLVERSKKMISTEGGEVLSEDRWGRRKLTFPIEHCRESYYYYLKFKSPPGLVVRLDGQWRLQEPILRSMIVRQEERKTKVKSKSKVKAP
ncbi:MAG: 30S ribosomal protein S6 [Elusimicrobia bacterium]|nr:30S ribosomal protein S6 [Elusimicrobiota bacterium]